MILHWKFRNNHVWQHAMDTEDNIYNFVYRVGLTTNPDIIEVWVTDGAKKTTIFIRK